MQNRLICEVCQSIYQRNVLSAPPPPPLPLKLAPAPAPAPADADASDASGINFNMKQLATNGGQIFSKQLYASLEKLPMDTKGQMVIDSGTREVYVTYPHLNSDLRSNATFECVQPYSIGEELLLYIRDIVIPGANDLVHDLEKNRVQDLQSLVINYSNFALLFSGSSCGQISHMKVEKTDYQFICVLGEKVVPSTLIKEDEPKKEDVAEFLNLPSDVVTTTMRHYKGLFETRTDIKKKLKPVSPNGWQPGTLCLFRGGVTHAGPPHDEPRVVLFFVGTDQERASADYNPNTQYHPWSVISDLLIPDDHLAGFRENLQRAHARVVCDWSADERCLRHESFLKDLVLASEYMQSLVSRQKTEDQSLTTNKGQKTGSGSRKRKN
jgi:hypothetical protein